MFLDYCFSSEMVVPAGLNGLRASLPPITLFTLERTAVHDISLLKYLCFCKGHLTVCLHQSASDLCFPAGWTRSRWVGRQWKEEFYVMLARGHKTHESSVCSQFHRCPLRVERGRSELLTGCQLAQTST